MFFDLTFFCLSAQRLHLINFEVGSCLAKTGPEVAQRFVWHSNVHGSAKGTEISEAWTGIAAVGYHTSVMAQDAMRYNGMVERRPSSMCSWILAWHTELCPKMCSSPNTIKDPRSRIQDPGLFYYYFSQY